jgi:hypothetical protein
VSSPTSPSRCARRARAHFPCVRRGRVPARVMQPAAREYQPSGELVEPRQGGCGRASTGSARRRKSRRGTAIPRSRNDGDLFGDERLDGAEMQRAVG